MRKISVLTFITLDGVMQAPGGPTEDTSGNFKFGGWVAPFFDDYAGKLMGEQMQEPYELLLGRVTFEIFAGYWPQHAAEWPGINSSKKYVVSSTMTAHPWENSVFINDNVVDALKQLKQQNGPDLKVWGSGKLVQTLMQNDLVDDFYLKIFPVTLGSGKKLFAEGTIPAAFTLLDSKISPKGVIFATYTRAGDVKLGSF